MKKADVKVMTATTTTNPSGKEIEIDESTAFYLVDEETLTYMITKGVSKARLGSGADVLFGMVIGLVFMALFL